MQVQVNREGGREEEVKGEDITERVKTPSRHFGRQRSPSCVVYETSYLNITLFVLIINLDYSRHLKRPMKAEKKEKNTKEKGEERFYTINEVRS